MESFSPGLPGNKELWDIILARYQVLTGPLKGVAKERTVAEWNEKQADILVNLAARPGRERGNRLGKARKKPTA